MKAILKLIALVWLTNLSFGQTGWYQQTSGSFGPLFGVSFIDANNGWVIGGGVYIGRILKTTNGGVNWIDQSIGVGALFDVTFVNTNIGWIVGQFGNIWKTIDGGQSWVNQPSGTSTYLNGVSFSDSFHGTVVGGFQSFNLGIILRTTNGGQNWIDQLSGISSELNAVSFIDVDKGWVVGYDGTILKTTNGGQNWIYQYSGTNNILFGVSFIDKNNGWVVGDLGTILRTTDGGQNWITQSSGTTNYLLNVCFVNPNNGWIVGSIGKILSTTNGGQNWISQASGTTNFLYALSFTDSLTGTAVGANATILRTIDGGIPVKLSSFTASVNNNNVILNWSTASETNNKGFEVQRSEIKDQKSDWENIGFVPGFGTTTEIKFYSFTDERVPSGKYSYRLKQIDYNGSFEYSNIVHMEVSLPLIFSLNQNYPNPFNPTTRINYFIPISSHVNLKVYDVLGKEVSTLVNEEQPQGVYEIEFDGSGLSSGVYFYMLASGDFIQTKKLILMK